MNTDATYAGLLLLAALGCSAADDSPSDRPNDEAAPEETLSLEQSTEMAEDASTEATASTETLSEPGNWRLLDLDPVDCSVDASGAGAIAFEEDFYSDDPSEFPSTHTLFLEARTLTHSTQDYTTRDQTVGINSQLEHEVHFPPEAISALQSGTSVEIVTEPGGSRRCPHTHRVVVHSCSHNLAE